MLRRHYKENQHFKHGTLWCSCNDLFLLFWDRNKEDAGFVWCPFFNVYFLRTKRLIPTAASWRLNERKKNLPVVSACNFVHICNLVSVRTQALVLGSLIRSGWRMAVHYVRAITFKCAHINLRLCSGLVRVVRRVSQPGESAGLALVVLMEGRHFRGSRTPWHQSPQSPRQTGSIWALSAPLAPADSDLYDGREECNRSGRGKIWARFLRRVQKICGASKQILCECMA